MGVRSPHYPPTNNASVAELGDALDLGSGGAIRGGSSPSRGTSFMMIGEFVMGLLYFGIGAFIAGIYIFLKENGIKYRSHSETQDAYFKAFWVGVFWPIYIIVSIGYGTAKYFKEYLNKNG